MLKKNIFLLLAGEMYFEVMEPWAFPKSRYLLQ